MNDPITIRPAVPADTLALGRLGAMLVALHHDFDQERFIAATPETARGYAAFLAQELDRAGVVVLVAQDGAGEVIGYVYGELEGHDWMSLRGPAGVIHDILVDTGQRGRGVGRLLLEAMVAALTDAGAPRVLLSAASHNEAARKLFASAGFRPTMVEMTREA